jgi:NTE family protein
LRVQKGKKCLQYFDQFYLICAQSKAGMKLHFPLKNVSLGILFIWLLLIATASFAQPLSGRGEKVCLALSGGGARGLAHVGVLKEIEAANIKIDCIAGTSMGAVIGGLYASGLKVSEIEALMVSMEWSQVLTQHQEGKSFREKENRYQYNIPFKLSTEGGRIRLPDGVVGADFFEEKLSQWTSKVESIRNFDLLPIQFRAVATRLGTGERVAIAQGSIAQAMRASMSVPGLFPPARIGNALFIDGGLVENLPVQAAKDMGASIVIAVNVGTPVSDEKDIVSFVDVTLQTVQILTEVNVREQISKLGTNDILISPTLADFQFLDFVKTKQIITQGSDAVSTSTLISSRLSKLAQSRGNVGPISDKGNSKERTSSEGSVSVPPPSPTQSSTNSARFGLALGTDLNRSYVRVTAALEQKLSDPNAKWISSLEIGRIQRINSSILYSPNPETGWYFGPSVDISRRYLPIYAQDIRFGELSLQRAQLRFDTGYVSKNSSEIRSGVFFERVSAGVESKGFFNVGNFSVIPAPTESVNVVGIDARYSIDTRDKSVLPTQGFKGSIDLQIAKPTSGIDANFSTGMAEATKYISLGQNVLEAHVNAAQYFRSGLINPVQFSLGGFQRLSGFDQDRFVGRSLIFSRIVARRDINPQNVFGYRQYIGLSLEAGRISNQLFFSNLADSGPKYAGSIFWALETPIGPFYAALGLPKGERPRAYLFLGRP